MKLSSNLFVVLSTMVVGTVWIAAEPCLLEDIDNDDSVGHGGYGKYDQPACDACADSGKNKGECCNAIYLHSNGRNDDDALGNGDALGNCIALNHGCAPGAGDCYPGLVCDGPRSTIDDEPYEASTCKLPTNNPNAHAASSLVTLRSSSTGHTLDPFVVVVVGLLGAAMTMLYHTRHRGGLLRRHQYNAVDAATATRMDV